MIYTVTFNPAIDYCLTLPCLLQGEINRSTDEKIFVGGKGINVSLVLKEFGFNSTALGFVAGFTGEYIENELKNADIKTDFVHLKSGFSRINVKLRSAHETDINALGPNISPEELNEFLLKIDALKDGDILILSGSIPKTLPDDMYSQILLKLKNKSVKTVVDAQGDLLKNTLEYHPFLIKPNHKELSEILKTPINTLEDALMGAEKLQQAGALNVLVTLAEKGAVLLDQNGNRYKITAPKGKLINSVGAGDSTVAGFISGYLATKNFEHALKLGVASGSATAFSEGLAGAKEITDCFNTINK